MTGPARPVRVLHVLAGMDRGGVETWLMHVLRRLDRERFQLDFLVHADHPCAFDDELRALGGRLLRGQPPRPLARYALSLRRTLAAHGPYDVVHSHLHHFSGVVLSIARHAGVPVRIAHCHSDTRRAEEGASWARRLYLRSMKLAIRRSATLLLAASQEAAMDLFGPRWAEDPRARVLHYGIELQELRAPVDRARVRAELGLALEAFVVGHAGRFVTAKNHDFLVEVHRQVLGQEPGARLLLVGDGPLQARTRERCRLLGLSPTVLFTGVRADVPRIMRGAFDVLALPSLYEGLPLVALEAQAAGLPVLLSTEVSAEAVVVPPLVRRLPLSLGPEAWAAEVLRARAAPPVTATEVLSHFEGSSFDIATSCAAVAGLYSAGPERGRHVGR